MSRLERGIFFTDDVRKRFAKAQIKRSIARALGWVAAGIFLVGMFWKGMPALLGLAAISLFFIALYLLGSHLHEVIQLQVTVLGERLDRLEKLAGIEYSYVDGLETMKFQGDEVGPIELENLAARMRGELIDEEDEA